MYDNIVSCWRCGADIEEKDSFMLELSCYDHEGRLHPMFPPSLGETSMDTARVRLPVCEACMKKLSHGFFSVREEEEEKPGCLVQDRPEPIPSGLDECCGKDHGACSCSCGSQHEEHVCACKKDTESKDHNASTSGKKEDAPYVPHIRGHRVAHKPRVYIVSVPEGIDPLAINLIGMLDCM